MCISLLILVFMFIGDTLEMDQDEVLTRSLSQIYIRTYNERRMSNATHTSSETPSNAHSPRWAETSRDSSVLYGDTGMCLKFMHMQNFEYACIFIFVLNIVH